MSPESSDADARHGLGDYIRDPDRAMAPAGIEERRLKIYRELFFNNIESMLAGNFPVIKRIFTGPPDPGRWSALVRDFYRDHPSRTPLFTELAREFLRYLETRAADGATKVERNDPPWLPELAHYEWVELALQISESREDDLAHDPDGNLLDGCPVVSPLAWPLSYTWPVHRIGPDHQPDTPPAEPTCLLLQRDAAGKVNFQQLSALTFRLLQRLEQHPGLSGRDQLQALAREAATEADNAFIAQGLAMLQQLRATAVILGTLRD
ncbi:HvfC family RiPP maturation protein [Novilysobacter erysipheiresistens]|uniref:DNA-binding domain-containing protein n=1 Tax=Novilysobacter erysipheiresistens TaxID=1749332 RepID=A0ABU7YUI7_9GAMM